MHTWDPRTATCVICGITTLDIAMYNKDPGCVVVADETKCEECGHVLTVGDWPFCPHDRATPSKGFEPYFDIGLGREVTGWGDVRQSMREQHLDFRDHPSREQTDRYYDRARRLREREGRT